MLSYQHAYHAGNAADVHKHVLLAAALAHMVRKDKPLTYLETHAGRGLYDLSSAPARTTGEAAAGVERLLTRLPDGHPWRSVVEVERMRLGPHAYPGSPLIAARLTRPIDRLDLAELHPQEHAALVEAMPRRPGLRIHRRDGLEMARAIAPPTPRRGLMLIDPSWEVRADYARLAGVLPRLNRVWNVGVLMLWYPILADRRHGPMVRAIRTAIPDALVHEVAFPPARDGHGLRGSGMVVVNPPWGLEEEAARLDSIFAGD
ncbi:MAG: 23S rRNA (adenine(2030)-N(6))-methyltransferase RlmJ [Pseudomonadota bacterium]